ncbi:ABC transporter ATP-binding protein [Pseudomonas sp. NFXW11]|uniref:ABC transporter ATP-binding protein n=1 Tax=Pseudomonas sp. NFXW11 TaxID=2819531 RepID=UPI003CF12AF6
MNSSPGLCADALGVRHGRRPIIHDLSLPLLQPGSVTAVLGPNGAGKSSLLRAMAGLHPLQGSLRLDGVELADYSLQERSRRVLYMPQSLPASLDLCVLDCLLAALDSAASREQRLIRAFAALQQVGIAALADQLLSRLSGGQRQLVSLAQVLVLQPRVMLLDEPTSALDPGFQLKVMHCVRAQVEQQQCIALMVLHDINLAARFADTLAVLWQGRLYACGTPRQVLTRQLFQEVYGVQARVEPLPGTSKLQVIVEHALD